MFQSTVQAIIATNMTGDSRGKFFTDLQTSVTSVLHALFPYNKKKSSTPEDRTKSDLRVLQRFMDANNYSIKKEN